ncbi:MAG: tRNA pseudouridine synthase A [Planctomycetes bacterium]|nr:tRNA pseudouridine synthase A [Planctomycetota bacterium]
MPRYAIECEWDGSAAQGTAPQTSATQTLHGYFVTACQKIEEPQMRLRCSSRLDAGVSAVALPAHIDLQKDWDPHALARALNVHLPDCLAVRRIADLRTQNQDWDALTASSSKHYCYSVLCQAWKPAIQRQSLWVNRLPQAQLLPQMAAQIIGKHDLSAFACLRGDGSDDNDPVREYLAAAWSSEPREGSVLWQFHISGRGFLYKQIRGLVGAMIAVGMGSYDISEFERMLQQGRASEQRSGNIAAAEGLQLLRVDYDQPPQWQEIEW